MVHVFTGGYRTSKHFSAPKRITPTTVIPTAYPAIVDGFFSGSYKLDVRFMGGGIHKVVEKIATNALTFFPFEMDGTCQTRSISQRVQQGRESCFWDFTRSIPLPRVVLAPNGDSTQGTLPSRRRTFRDPTKRVFIQPMAVTLTRYTALEANPARDGIEGHRIDMGIWRGPGRDGARRNGIHPSGRFGSHRWGKTASKSPCHR